MNNDMIYGIHPVMEALKASKSIDKILIKKEIKGNVFQEIKELCKAQNIYLNRVPEEKIKRLVKTGNHQGVIAFISPIEFYQIQDILPQLYETGKTPFLLALDSISDVRNLGAIVRSAECLGVDAIIIPQKGSAAINKEVVKSSAGAIFNVKICKQKSLINALKYCKDYGVKLYAATEKSNTYAHHCQIEPPLCLIMGAEGDGISEDILKISDYQIKIPLLGQTHSFNVSVAAGIMLYEICRQNDFFQKTK